MNLNSLVSKITGKLSDTEFFSLNRWRQLLTRTLRRDGGARNWARLEIYLDEEPMSET